MPDLLEQTIQNTVHRQPQLHVRFEGQSFDLDLTGLDIGPGNTDDQIKTAAAARLSTLLGITVPVSKLAPFQVDRHAESNDLTLRPAATFAADPDDDDGDDD